MNHFSDPNIILGFQKPAHTEHVAILGIDTIRIQFL